MYLAQNRAAVNSVASASVTATHTFASTSIDRRIANDFLTGDAVSKITNAANGTRRGRRKAYAGCGPLGTGQGTVSHIYIESRDTVRISSYP